MKIEIVGKKGKVLRAVYHEGQTYVQAPKAGAYKIRLTNDSSARKEAVVSVDGINILNGADAGYAGAGYVLAPWQTLEIPGWRRSDNKVAQFQFTEQGGSYANKTGRGTSNTGVIGVAVFAEQPQINLNPIIWVAPRYVHQWTYPAPSWNYDTTIIGCANTSSTTNSIVSKSILRSANSPAENGISNPSPQAIGTAFVNQVVDVGTAYGNETKFETVSTSFIRASSTPEVVLTLRYATRERLLSWGVPVDTHESSVPVMANPFPASQMAVPAPAGWHG